MKTLAVAMLAMVVLLGCNEQAANMFGNQPQNQYPFPSYQQQQQDRHHSEYRGEPQTLKPVFDHAPFKRDIQRSVREEEEWMQHPLYQFGYKAGFRDGVKQKKGKSNRCPCE